MDAYDFKDYFGVIHFEKNTILKKGLSLIDDFIVIENHLKALRQQSLKDLESTKLIILFKQYAVLLSYIDKEHSYKEEYLFASLSPYLEIFFKTLKSFKYRAPLSRIHNIQKIKCKSSLVILQPIENYKFDSLHQFDGLVRIEVQKAYKQFLLTLKKNLATDKFRKEIRAKQQAIDKSNSAFGKFIEELFSKYKTLSVMGAVTYMPSIKLIFNDNFIVDEEDHLLEKTAMSELNLKLSKLTAENYMELREQQQSLIAEARQNRILRQKNRQEKCNLAVLAMKNDLIAMVKKIYRKNLVGYIWKVEYARSGGFYIRFYFFFVPMVHEKLNKMTIDIERLWVNKVTTDGYFQNNNIRGLKGLGLVSYDNKTDFDALKAQIQIMVKSDYFVNIKFDGRRPIGKTKP